MEQHHSASTLLRPVNFGRAGCVAEGLVVQNRMRRCSLVAPEGRAAAPRRAFRKPLGKAGSGNEHGSSGGIGRVT